MSGPFVVAADASAAVDPTLRAVAEAGEGLVEPLWPEPLACAVGSIERWRLLSATCPILAEPVAAALVEQFPDADEHTVLLVAARDDGAPLSDTDLTALGTVSADVETQIGHEPHGPIVSDDGAAAGYRRH